VVAYIATKEKPKNQKKIKKSAAIHTKKERRESPKAK
jgi:hypothetical protein